MISDANRYYGSAISTIIDVSKKEILIERVERNCAGFYLINNNLPIYIKYSTSRRGPWSFNFQKSHQETHQNIYQKYNECIIAFVCGKDGIAALTHKNFRKVLDESFDDQEAVTIRRRHNAMYQIRGKDGAFEKRVSRSSLEEILNETINYGIINQ